MALDPKMAESSFEAQYGVASSAAMQHEPALADMDTYLGSKGLKRIPIVKDGSCLFRAIAAQLPGLSQAQHDMLRQSCVDFLVRNRDDYEPFMAVPFDHYVFEIRRLSGWGGEIELQCMARLLNLEFAIFQEANKPPLTVTSGAEGASVVRLCFTGGNHYDCVVPAQWAEKARMMQGLLYDVINGILGLPCDSEDFSARNVQYEVWLNDLRTQHASDRAIAASVDAQEKAAKGDHTKLSGYYRKGGEGAETSTGRTRGKRGGRAQRERRVLIGGSGDFEENYEHPVATVSPKPQGPPRTPDIARDFPSLGQSSSTSSPVLSATSSASKTPAGASAWGTRREWATHFDQLKDEGTATHHKEESADAVSVSSGDVGDVGAEFAQEPEIDADASPYDTYAYDEAHTASAVHFADGADFDGLGDDVGDWDTADISFGSISGVHATPAHVHVRPPVASFSISDVSEFAVPFGNFAQPPAVSPLVRFVGAAADRAHVTEGHGAQRASGARRKLVSDEGIMLSAGSLDGNVAASPGDYEINADPSLLQSQELDEGAFVAGASVTEGIPLGGGAFGAYVVPDGVAENSEAYPAGAVDGEWSAVDGQVAFVDERGYVPNPYVEGDPMFAHEAVPFYHAGFPPAHYYAPPGFGHPQQPPQFVPPYFAHQMYAQFAGGVPPGFGAGHAAFMPFMQQPGWATEGAYVHGDHVAQEGGEEWAEGGGVEPDGDDYARRHGSDGGNKRTGKPQGDPYGAAFQPEYSEDYSQGMSAQDYGHGYAQHAGGRGMYEPSGRGTYAQGGSDSFAPHASGRVYGQPPAALTHDGYSQQGDGRAMYAHQSQRDAYAGARDESPRRDPQPTAATVRTPTKGLNPASAAFNPTGRPWR